MPLFRPLLSILLWLLLVARLDAQRLLPVKNVTLRGSHVCALLDGGSAKCWGWNGGGQLGQGHTNNIGDGANEMGDNLPAIDLGSNKTVV